MKVKSIILAAIASTIMFNGCNDKAKIVSRNLSQQADNFGVDRRIIFYNGITDKTLLEIQGKCNIEVDNNDRQLEVTCRTGAESYKKHYLGLSDNVTYFVEQLESRGANAYHYRVTFNPQSIVPDVDFKGSSKALKDSMVSDNED